VQHYAVFFQEVFSPEAFPSVTIMVRQLQPIV